MRRETAGVTYGFLGSVIGDGVGTAGDVEGLCVGSRVGRNTWHVRASWSRRMVTPSLGILAPPSPLQRRGKPVGSIFRERFQRVVG
jgi:hypothetical protein